MIYHAVIDTNVLVSALLSKKQDAATVQVIEKLLNGAIIPIYSRYIIKEYRTVLTRKKFNLSESNIGILLSALINFGILFEPTPRDIILPDVKDLPFYLVALQNQDKNSFLVTGNIKHFPQDPFIITPRRMIEILESGR